MEMKAALAESWVTCPYCKWRRATSPDHVPPLSAFAPGCWTGTLVPSCLRCNMSRGGAERQAKAPDKRRGIKRRRGTLGRSGYQ